jgi:capsular polysaccharide biosynthesis protein
METVELSDGVRRIVGQHWKLIAIYAVLGLAIGLALHAGKARTYTASARVVLDTQDPKTQPEAAAIADIASAIATSPTQVAQALADAHLRGRDATEVAQHHVTVQSLGSSGVAELSVSDTDARTAAALANALAKRVIATRLDVTRGQASQVGSDIDKKIADLSDQIAGADSRIDALTVQSASTTDPQRANSARAKRDELQRQRDFLAQQRSVLESERVGLLSTGALEPKPAVISSAAVPLHADSSGLGADLVLGLMLGLILGVGLAGLIETLRPTLVDGAAVGDELGAPVLGTLSGPPDGPLEPDEVMWAAARLRLAARSARVRHIGLVSTRPGLDLDPLAAQLEAALAPVAETSLFPVAAEVGGRGGSPEAPARHGVALRIHTYDPENPAMANGTVIGLVVVSPSPASKLALVDTSHLLRVSRAPLLGVVAFKP